MRQPRPFPRSFRVMAFVLVPALVLAPIPVAASSSDKAAEAAAAPAVKVNRTLPAIVPPPAKPAFSDPPTDAEISRARVFGEPLVPVVGAGPVEENRALAAALVRYHGSGNPEDVSALTGFLAAHSSSGWRASLLANLGAHYRRTGYFTKAEAVLAEAWALAKDAADSPAVGDQALAELLDLRMQFGRLESLERLLKEADGRDLHGGAVQKVAEARRSAAVLSDKHHEAFASAAVAVDQLMGYGRPGHFSTPRSRSTTPLPTAPRWPTSTPWPAARGSA